MTGLTYHTFMVRYESANGAPPQALLDYVNEKGALPIYENETQPLPNKGEKIDPSMEGRSVDNLYEIQPIVVGLESGMAAMKFMRGCTKLPGVCTSMGGAVSDNLQAKIEKEVANMQ